MPFTQYTWRHTKEKGKVSVLKELSINQSNDNKIKILWHPLLIKFCRLVKLTHSHMLLCTFVIAFILLLLATISTTNCSLVTEFTVGGILTVGGNGWD